MKKIVERIISCLLCLAMLIGVMPIEQSGGMASAANVYKYDFTGATGTSGGSRSDALDSEWSFNTTEWQGADISITPNANGALTLSSGKNKWGQYSGATRKTLQIYIPEEGTYKVAFVCGAGSDTSSIKVLMGATTGNGLSPTDNRIGDIPKTVAGNTFTATMEKNITVTQPGNWTVMLYEPDVLDGAQLILDSLVLTKITGDEPDEPEQPDEPENPVNPDVLDEAAAVVYNYTSTPSGANWAGNWTNTADGRWRITKISAGIVPGIDGGYLKFAKTSGYITQNDYIETEIYIPAGGIYELESTRYSVNASYECAYNVYAAPADVENAVQEEYLIGSVAVGNDAVSLKGLIDTEEAGYYKVVYVPIRKWSTGESGYYLRLRSLKISPVKESDEPEILTYNFTSLPSKGEWKGSYYTKHNMAWQLGETSKERNTTLKIESGGLSFGDGAYRFEDGVGEEWFDVNINVPIAGEYKMALQSLGGQYYGGAEIYVSTLGDENIKTDENFVGKVKKYGEKNAKYTTKIGQVTFDEAGIYTVRFKMTKHDGYYYTVFKMQLTPSDYVPSGDADLNKLELIPSFADNYIGEAGAYLRPVAYDSLGEVLDISGGEISYSSRDTTKAVVNEDGLVTPIAAGEVTMVARVELGNVSKEAECKITVKRREESQTAPIVYDFAECFKKGHASDSENAGCDVCGWSINTQNSTAAENVQFRGLYENGIKSVVKDSVVTGAFAVDMPVAQGGYYKVEITLARTGEDDLGSWMNIFIGRENGAGGNTLLMSKGNRKEWLGGLTIDAGNAFLPTGTAMLYLTHSFTTNLAIQRVRLVPVDPGKIVLSSDKLSLMNVSSTNRIYIYAKHDGKDVSANMIDMVASSSDEAVAKAKIGYSQDGTNRALEISSFDQGDVVITVEALVSGKKVAEFELPVSVRAGIIADAKIAADALMMHLESEGMQIRVDGTDLNGEHIGFTNDQIVWQSLNPEVATIDENGWLKPVSVGEVTVQAIINAHGYEQTLTKKFSVRNGKIRRSLFTEEKVANARENVKNYKWARDQQKSAVAEADKFLGKEEYLWNLVTSQELPRSVYVGMYSDSAAIGYCRYCNENILLKYGGYGGWKVDYKNSPWKVQCPECRRRFPTNDFGSFYNLGIVANDEEESVYGVPSGQWSYEKAHYEHFNKFAEEYAKAGISEYSVYDKKRKNGERLPPVGFLKNEMYDGLEHVETLNLGHGLYKGEDPDGWGVDDGYGYMSGRIFNALKAPARDTYIAYYNMWGLMYGGGAYAALQSLTDAYVLTGDAKYGRLGAILTDRFADVWPEFKYGELTPVTGGSRGKIVDQIWSTSSADTLSKAYDAFFPMFDDEYVINFLNKKSQQFDLGDKSSGEALRKNCEEGILRTNFDELKNSNLLGNFGFHQETAAITAIVYDSAPETGEIIDWMFANGHNTGSAGGYNSGGNIWRQIYDYVDRDGFGNEAAPGYNRIWIDQIVELANLFEDYGKVDEKYDLYKNPIVLKMFDSFTHLISVRRTTPQIADSGSFALDSIYGINISTMLEAYKNTGNIKFAQLAYWRNGDKSDGLKYDIYTKDPESPVKEIADIIKQYGEFDGFNKSEQLAGYGISFLRGGDYVPSSVESNIQNTLYDYWMYYGYTGKYGNSHSHDDSLNIGMSAYGTYVSADFGYPANWGDTHTSTSLAHNIVQINDADADGLGMTGANVPAFPRHFDDAGLVKVMDVDGSNAYKSASKYRRTVVAIEASDDIAYAIDFFRVAGGNKHVYAFHPVSNEIVSTTGLDSAVSKRGTYAGENIEFSKDNKTSAERTSYIREDKDPESIVSVDYRIDDIRDYLTKPIDLRLRVTMLGADELDDFTMAKMQPPIRDKNPDWMETIFARRTGNNLTSLFNTVFEPFANEPYIESIEQATVTRDGKEVSRHEASAIKVKLVNGRVDYIVNTENTTVTYRVDDLFDFQGFLGVYMLKDGQPVYSYGNDASVVGDMTSLAEVTGTVDSFTQGNQIENYIRVKLDQDVEPESLVGKWIDINNDKQRNAAYEIRGAKRVDNDLVELDVGDSTFVKGLKAIDYGTTIFNYIIKAGQTFRIPLTVQEDTSPVIEPISPINVFTGSKISVPIRVNSPVGREITISGADLIRGASVDDNGVVTWTPDNNQIGSYTITVQVDDGVFKKTATVPVNVYKSVGNAKEETVTPPSVDENTAGGGAGAGGDTTKPEDTKPEDTKPEDTKPDDSTGTGDDVPDGPNSPTEKFIDLGSHSWAKDAIYALVDAGVVNGTSENTYSPAANIKRADFAIMLVRAFKVTEGETEHFADVDASKYYAKELLLAKANGIVGGIGDNKFNPEGEITRQDMMLMLYRALRARGYEVDDPNVEVLSNFADAARISEYAVDAVSALVKSGIIGGAGNMISPASNATRAEVAVTLSRVLGK